jgi:hypothetical protein
MHWLETHAWLAAWLALPVAIVVGVIQTVRGGVNQLDWPRALIYLAFLTSLAVMFTPTFDQTARDFARYIVSFTIVVLIWDMKPRKKE